MDRVIWEYVKKLIKWEFFGCGRLGVFCLVCLGMKVLLFFLLNVNDCGGILKCMFCKVSFVFVIDLFYEV